MAGEKQHTTNGRLYSIFKTVGERMNIQNIPGSLNDLQRFAEAYEKNNVVLTETNHAVGKATINIVKGWMPFFLRPFVLPVMNCLLDTNMLTALGYATPPSFLKVLVNGAMKIRALGLRKITFKRYPSFVTTERNRTYPKGYEIRQLGPENLVKRL
jgi:hypothetical protein